MKQKTKKPSQKQRKEQADAVVVGELKETSEANRMGVYLLAIALFFIGFGLSFLALFPFIGAFGVFLAAGVGALLSSCIRVAAEWERVVVLRFGRFNRIAGPGLYFLIPFVEFATVRVDQRMRILSFSAEAALTLDLVPVDIDAVIFWVVWDAEKACMEVENYPQAVLWSAQTAMRDAIGKLNLADLSPRRKQIDSDLQKLLGEKCEQWGISVLSVEIRDITIPEDLQDALSREAQAQSERNARVLLAEVEKDISEMLVDAAAVYDQNPNALKLRAMNLAYEGAREGKGVLLAPSSLADGFTFDIDAK